MQRDLSSLSRSIPSICSHKDIYISYLDFDIQNVINVFMSTSAILLVTCRVIFLHGSSDLDSFTYYFWMDGWIF